jgi:hypothetical protein
MGKSHKPSSKTVAWIEAALIGMAVVAVVAFVAGMRYANNQHAAVDTAVKAATTEVASEPSKK